MNIFNSNQRLEELTLYALDWGLFLRHNSEEVLLPFLCLQKGKDIFIRVMVTEEDPIEYAQIVLNREEKDFDLFVIGGEVYLRGENNQSVEAILVHGFDVTQEKGVILGQMFQPVEKGGFKKIDRIRFLGNPELIISKKENIPSNYSTEGIDFNPVAITDNGNLTSYMSYIIYDNPSVISNSIKQFIKNKLIGDKRDFLTGSFEFSIHPQKIKNKDFLNFLLTNYLDELIQSEEAKDWLRQTKRKLNIVCRMAKDIIYRSEDRIRKLNSASDKFRKTIFIKGLFFFFIWRKHISDFFNVTFEIKKKTAIVTFI
jgi:hypothetical protein